MTAKQNDELKPEEELARLISKHLSGRYISSNIWKDINPMDAFKCGYSKCYAKELRKTFTLTNIDNAKQRRFMIKVAKNILKEVQNDKRE